MESWVAPLDSPYAQALLLSPVAESSKAVLDSLAPVALLLRQQVLRVNAHPESSQPIDDRPARIRDTHMQQ
jgi:hypothetical protein